MVTVSFEKKILTQGKNKIILIPASVMKEADLIPGVVYPFTVSNDLNLPKQLGQSDIPGNPIHSRDVLPSIEKKVNDAVTPLEEIKQWQPKKEVLPFDEPPKPKKDKTLLDELEEELNKIFLGDSH